MSTQTYTVEGMTCGHCAQAVAREVSAVDGITDVAVDVSQGTVTVAGAASDEAIAAAVAEAGYAFAGRA
ncbi:heavy-metal-associated domain-containing protein [Microbacterium sp. bgisy189]|uniref:heavy-metal-associated domain-containing protein n=1 Tax=Microbacterium sp. bgisy189 TaxID=3413798 RepID=UPI003EBBB263